MYPIYTYGTEEQKQRWLPDTAVGRSHRLLRPDRAGLRLEPRRHADHARRDGDGWVLNGEKTWITNGSVADIAVVWARTESGIQGFLVERGTPGYSASDITENFPCVRRSHRASLFRIAGFPPPKPCRAKGLKRTRLSDPGAIRHRMGCRRRGNGLLRNSPSIHDPAQAVRRSAHRQPSTGAGETGLDDHGDHESAVAGAAGGPLKDQGRLEPAHVSMLKRNNVAMALECARLSAGPAGRQRDHGRVSDHAPHVQSRDRQNV